MKTRLLPLVLLSLSQGVLAQQLPGAGAQLQQLPPPPVPQAAAPVIRIEESTAPAAPGSESVRVLVNELRLSGTHAFTPAELIAAARFKPGSQLTLSDLQAMAARITEFYRQHGYFVARAYLPAQDVTSHVVTIAVSEGQYGKVTVRNQSRLSDRIPAGLLTGLNTGDAITIAPLESRLLLLSDVPGVKVSSTLVPGATPGTSDLVVDVAPAPLVSGSIDADNAGNPYTGEYRLGATVYLNDPFGIGDLASLRLLTSGSGLKYGRAAYQVPFGRVTAGVAYSKLDYELGKQFKVLGAHGTADVASVFATVPLLRSRASNLYAGLAYDDKTFRDQIDLFNAVTDKEARVATLSLYGNHQDNIGGGGMSTFFASVSSGSLDIQTPGALAIDDASARTNGRYNKFWFNATRIQRITDRVSLRGDISGQLASKNLDASEKFVLGGMDGVRAYPQGEGFGDEGVIANVEASLLLAGLSAHVPGQVHVLGFVDGGRITINKNPWFTGAIQPDNQRTLGSYGVGMTWDAPGNFAVRTYYAWKLGNEKAISAPDKNGRFWIQAIKYF